MSRKRPRTRTPEIHGLGYTIYSSPDLEQHKEFDAHGRRKILTRRITHFWPFGVHSGSKT